MLSDKKPVLLVAVISAATGSCLTLGLAVLIQFGLFAPDSLRPFLGPILGLAVVAFAAAVTLQLEYAQVLRGGPFKLFTEVSLSFGQFVDSLHWCPSIISAVTLPTAAVSIVLSFVDGFAPWSSEQPLSVEVGRSIMLFQASFLLFSLRIVLSGYRAPGSFSLQVRTRSSWHH
jgi:hypothetical protein